MTLEQLLSENTAAMNRLADAFNSVTQFAADFAQTNLGQLLHAEEPAATKVEEAPAESEAAPIATPEDKPLSYDDVAQAVTALVKAHGRDKAAGVLAQFNAKTLKDVPQEKWAEVKAAAQAAMEG